MKGVVSAVAVAVGASAISSANSRAFPMDPYEHDFKVGFGVDLTLDTSAGTGVSASGGGGTFTVQKTFDDPSNVNAVWFDHSTVCAQTSDVDGTLDYPVNAMRVQVQACAAVAQTVSAKATLMVIQAGNARYETRKF